MLTADFIWELDKEIEGKLVWELFFEGRFFLGIE